MASEKALIPAVNVDIGQDESLTVDEALAKVAMLLAKTEYPKMLSEVNDSEIRLISALYAVAERTKNVMIINFLLYFLQLRVSHKRKGREEVLKIAQSSKNESDAKFSRLKSIFSGMR